MVVLGHLLPIRGQEAGAADLGARREQVEKQSTPVIRAYINLPCCTRSRRRQLLLRGQRRREVVAPRAWGTPLLILVMQRMSLRRIRISMIRSRRVRLAVGQAMRLRYIPMSQSRRTSSMLLCASPLLPFPNTTRTNRENLERNSDDTFIIRSREKGWWVVQRDVAGTGVPSTNPEDAPKWIPAGCLLETTLPPNQAIAETWAAVPPSSSPTVTSPTAAGASTKRPILPAHIISTSFPGITLMGYGDKGEHELNLVRGDVLRVFKRYNHWSYVSRLRRVSRLLIPTLTYCCSIDRPSKKRQASAVGYLRGSSGSTRLALQQACQHSSHLHLRQPARLLPTPHQRMPAARAHTPAHRRRRARRRASCCRSLLTGMGMAQMVSVASTARR